MPYLYLGIAIVCELIGTTLLKYAEGFTRLWPSVFCILSYMICYIFFSKSLLNINLSMAYATWCGLGIVASTLLSIFLFKESINMIGIIGIILIIIGVVIVNVFATPH